jgi:hypothetical protein
VPSIFCYDIKRDKNSSSSGKKRDCRRLPIALYRAVIGQNPQIHCGGLVAVDQKLRCRFVLPCQKDTFYVWVSWPTNPNNLNRNLNPATFTILITTKNRLEALRFTLDKIAHLLARPEVNCIICDDGSTDGTTDYLQKHHPEILRIRNEKSRGLIYSRNKLLGLTTSDYAISIDDDLHFITLNPMELIADYFESHPECSLVGFRIFWSKAEPSDTQTSEKPVRMKSFAGGAHAWRMSSWRQIPIIHPGLFFTVRKTLPLMKCLKRLEIHYLPSVLVHHRVDLKARKKTRTIPSGLGVPLESGLVFVFLCSIRGLKFRGSWLIPFGSTQNQSIKR